MIDFSLLPPGARIEHEDLVIGGCSVTDLAVEYGTPAYTVDEGALRERASRYRAAFTSRHADTMVCFAGKSFPSASVIRVLVEEGLGCDVVGGELAFALAAGARGAAILMHGNAKSDSDIRAALDADIRWIVVDGFDDVERIARLATRRVPVWLRVVPGIDADTHDAMATGGAGSKFGVAADQVPEAIRRMRAEPLIDLQGLHAHIGSQVTDLDQFEAEVSALARFERFAPFAVGRWDGPVETVDLVGRHCESGDVVTPHTPLVTPRRDDLIVVPVTGAYCFTMPNTYNAAPARPWSCAVMASPGWRSGASGRTSCSRARSDSGAPAHGDVIKPRGKATCRPARRAGTIATYGNVTVGRREPS